MEHLLNTAILLAVLIVLLRQNRRLKTITKKEGLIMAEIDDLKQAVADETQAIKDGNDTDARLLADIDQAVQKLGTPGINPADVKAAAQAISEATATLRANNQANADAAAKIEAALNPPA